MSLVPYRLCAIDLDDTLLGPDHLISNRNARAIQAVVRAGVIVVIASGRMHETTLKYAEQLDLNTPIISYNGAMVKQPRNGEVWLHKQVAADLAARVMAYCAPRGLQLNYYLGDRLYTAAYTSWMKLYQERTSATVDVKPDLYTSLRGTSPTKMIIVDSPQHTDERLPFFRDMFGPHLYVTKSNDEYLEFMPPDANKGAALEVVANRYKLTAGQTVAFGDSWNDVPMIEWAGLGIAVANAKPELIAAADRVARSSAEDGVGIALEEIYAPLLNP